MNDGRDRSRDGDRTQPEQDRAPRHRRDGPPDLRVGDADRSAAMRALDAHLEAGRLGVEEYGDRSAAAVSATTASELAALFGDLPAPHPALPEQAGAVTPAPLPVPRPEPHRPVVPALAFGLIIMLMMVVPMIAAAAAGAGLSPGGLVMLPFLFLVVGGIGRHGRGHRGPGHHGPGPDGPRR